MKTIKTIILIFFFLNCFSRFHAQTGGSSTLSSIESLVRQEEANSKKVGELNQKHMDSYVNESLKTKKIQDEISNLERKKNEKKDQLDAKLQAKLDEIENSQSWINRRESAQKGYKEYNAGTCSAGGPPPICVAKHWYQVSVSEAMEGYDALVAKELNDIKKDANKFDQSLEDKRSELFDFQDGENEFSDLRSQINDDMNKLLGENEDLRKKIVALSKIYKEQVMAYAKSIQSAWISDLMRMIAEKHVIEDKMAIYEVQLLDLEALETKTIADTKEKVRKQNDAEIQKINEQIKLEDSKILSLVQKLENDVSSIENTIIPLERRLNEIDLIQDNLTKLTDAEILAINAEETDVKGKINESREGLKRLEDNFEMNKTALQNNIKMFQDKSWGLTTNLSKRQEAAIVTVKQVFEIKRKVLNDALVARKFSLQKHGDLLLQKKTLYRQQFLDYADRVKSEQDRLVIACRNSGASCFGTDTHGDVIGQWNNALACIGGMESSRVMNGVYFGCEEEAVTYKSHYNTQMSGLSNSEIEALERKVTKTRYDMIFRKVTN